MSAVGPSSPSNASASGPSVLLMALTRSQNDGQALSSEKVCV